MIKRTLFFGNPVYLSTKYKQLVVSFPNEVEKKTIPIEDIGIIVLENSQITLTSRLLIQLTENNTIVLLCDDKHMPYSIMQPISGNSIFSERIRIQINMSEALRKNLWFQTVYAKIKNQAKHLEYESKSALKLNQWLKEMKIGDGDNHEAYAAAYYFQNIFSLDGFSRNDKEIAPNHWLNYGYAVLRAVAARAICGTGLMPALGIFHKNRYNAYCLADDLMEPYRPFVDKIVQVLVKRYGLRDTIEKEHKELLLRIPALDVLMDGTKSPLLVAMSRTTNSYFECLCGKRRKIIYPDFC